MTFHAHPVPPVPDATAAATLAAFPNGNPYVSLREELGTLFTDDLFVDWFASLGAPVEVAPWRLALVLILQELETLSDRQAADNVRRCLDWKYVLSLELTDPGFDHTLLHDFRDRMLANQAEQRLFDTLLDAFKARGLLKPRQRQRTDATHVLANVRTRNRIACVGETLRHALEVLATAAPAWLVPHILPEWLDRYGLRVDEFRLPSKPEARLAMVVTMGHDGRSLLHASYALDAPAWLRALPAVATLRQLWLQQFVTVDGELRFRNDKELPPAAQQLVSPYDPDARWSRKRATQWTGSKVHLTETADEDTPNRLTHVATTHATTQDVNLTTTLQADLAARDLLPGEQIVDAAYVSSEVIVSSRTEHEIELVGPVAPDTSWQARAQTGYDVAQFVVDWDGQKACCPAGKTSTLWREREHERGQPVVTIWFDLADGRACSARSSWSTSEVRPRILNLRPQGQHEALQQVRQAQETDAFKQRYAKRAGIEGTIAQGAGRFGLRRTPYRGLAKTHLHHILIAIAINLTRVVAWLDDSPRSGPYPRRSRFAALAAACSP
ncbi:MAG: IS1182 family transposase [Blastochloris sp.]|nr:IS1182 family transposase [Blastochloris sp.]